MTVFTRATILGGLSAVPWGLSVVWVRALSDQLGPCVAGMLLHGSLFAIGCATSSLIRRREVIVSALNSPWFYLRGCFFITNVCLLYLAVGMSSQRALPLVTLLYYLWPTFTLLGAQMFIEYTIKYRTLFVLGLLASVGSIAFELLKGATDLGESKFDQNDIQVYCFAFCAAISWALYSLTTKKHATDSGGALVIPLFSAGVAIVFAVIEYISIDFRDVNWSSILPWLCAGVVTNYLGFTLWELGIRRGDVLIISLAADFIPWLALVGLYAFQGVELESRTLISAVCLVLAAVTMRLATCNSTKIVEVLQVVL